MPELPDITLYVDKLTDLLVNQELRRVRIPSPFLVRTVDPPVTDLEGRTVHGVARLGKRIVLALDADLYCILHLMIAGRLLWKPPGAKPPGKIGLAAFDFIPGTLVLTEAGTKRRASLHVVRGAAGLADHDRGGLEPLSAAAEEFRTALRRENHTLKRALTDPRLFSGIGNAYSDEILYAAGMSPVTLTRRLDDAACDRLHAATQATLTHWIEKLRRQFARRFPGPGDITAFRPDFAVHGRFEQPCPRCHTPVQRIRCADNETNYCPTCQTGGRVLADRSLSRLLKDDWPRQIEAGE